MPKTVRPQNIWLPVAATMFVVAWGGNEFTPLLVMYKNEGLSTATVGILLFAYVLGIIPALLIGGPLSDRYGRRKFVLPSLPVAALGSMVLAASENSVPFLFCGRILSGIAVGLVMAVGGSWLSELSLQQQPLPGRHSPQQTNPAPRRQAMSLTAGFGIGAAIAGVLAEWGPWQHQLSYSLNALLCLLCFMWVRNSPETVAQSTVSAAIKENNYRRFAAVRNRRFLFIVLPLAPWIFGAGATAYAILPNLMRTVVSGYPIAFSAILCAVTLGCGFGIQSLARKFDKPGTARASLVAGLLLATGMLVAAIAAQRLTIPLALTAAAVLGLAYGIALVAGLAEVARLAKPAELASTTAIFYSFTYLGFAIPTILALLHDHRHWSYPAMFVFACCAALVTTLVIRIFSTTDPQLPLTVPICKDK